MQERRTDRIQEIKAKLQTRKTMLLVLAACAVFITTYSLILPAFTLDEKSAEAQGGIDLATQTEQAAQVETDAQATDDAKAGQSQPAEAVQADPKDTGSEPKDADGENAQAETDAQAADAVPGNLAADGDGYRISAVYDESAALPEETELAVQEITSSDRDYEDWQALALEALREETAKEDRTGLKFSRFYDISLVADGSELEPAAPVDVTISYDKALPIADRSNVRVIHFSVNEKTGRLQGELLKQDDVKLRVKNNRMSQAAFETEGFSVFGLVETTIEKDVLTSDGHNYKVSVTCGVDAGIPAGADLSVEEITSGASEYDTYVSNTEDTLGMKKGSAGYIRLFDIKIIDADGNKIQPAEGSTVDVRVELADSDSKAFSVVHFADGAKAGNVVASKTDGQTVRFEADGFSVYAVVDEGTTDENSRMTLYFHDVEGNVIHTVFVKNSDDADVLEEIIYDPGDGHQAGNQLFKGWIIGDKNVSEPPAYTAEDADEAKDIEEIRTWAENVEIAEGDEYHIYPMVFQTYSVTFKDEDGVTFHSAALIFAASEDHADYTVNQSYTPKDQDSAFLGWYWHAPSTNAVRFKEAMTLNGVSYAAGDPWPPAVPIPNLSAVEIYDHVVLTPDPQLGNWLVFNENGRGASYTPPQFIAKEQKTERPADPTRLGYVFGGWYTNPECTGNQFTFGQKLEGRTTLYAKWTPVASAPYTIIIWKQNIDGDGYDFEESVQLNGTPNTTVNTVTQQGSGNDAYVRIRQGNQNVNKRYTGFHLNHFDSNVTITPEGNAVLNVYYDRTEYTLSFQIYDYTYTVSTNDNDNWPNKYGDVNGQKQRVYWNNGAFRTSNTWNGPIYTGTVYTRNDYQSWQTIKEITALYEQNISDNFPIVGTNGIIYDNGERWKPQANAHVR